MFLLPRQFGARRRLFYQISLNSIHSRSIRVSAKFFTSTRKLATHRQTLFTAHRRWTFFCLIKIFSPLSERGKFTAEQRDSMGIIKFLSVWNLCECCKCSTSSVWEASSSSSSEVGGHGEKFMTGIKSAFSCFLSIMYVFFLCYKHRLALPHNSLRIISVGNKRESVILTKTRRLMAIRYW